jgi:exosome complex RNA-binding protein Rrp4
MSEKELIACFPGQRICAANENTLAGVGTYERLGYIYSSLAGIVETKTEGNVSYILIQII